MSERKGGLEEAKKVKGREVGDGNRNDSLQRSSARAKGMQNKMLKVDAMVCG